MRNRIKNTGFTLIELAIVIVVVGLLLAGVATGASMIKKATFDTVITDMQSYKSAFSAFVERYRAIPGDMSKAEFYFPTCPVTAGNCNGNGNDSINQDDGGSYEPLAAWRVLYLANMIPTGIQAVIDSPGSEVLGLTMPSSKIKAAGYIMAGPGGHFGDGGYSGVYSPWADRHTNAVFIGKASLINERGLATGALEPGDAFNLDHKMDDGAESNGLFVGASTGKFRSITHGDSASGCVINSGANYDLTVTITNCISGFALN
jgi:prepilin-type N-terminal cleavage/methylation domain-containing protein